MVPGLTDTDCRIVEFRYRELHAEHDQQRRAAAATPVPAGRVRVNTLIQCRLEAVKAQLSHLFRPREATNLAAPSTVVLQ